MSDKTIICPVCDHDTGIERRVPFNRWTDKHRFLLQRLAAVGVSSKISGQLFGYVSDATIRRRLWILRHKDGQL